MLQLLFILTMKELGTVSCAIDASHSSCRTNHRPNGHALGDCTRSSSVSGLGTWGQITVVHRLDFSLIPRRVLIRSILVFLLNDPCQRNVSPAIQRKFPWTDLLLTVCQAFELPRNQYGRFGYLDAFEVTTGVPIFGEETIRIARTLDNSVVFEFPGPCPLGTLG